MTDASDDDHVVTRSEERLRISTESVATERVRVEKYIVTEERTVSVTVRREEVRLVREPIVDGPLMPSDTSGDIDLVLHEERIEVTTHVVPVERVRLVKSTVTEDRVVGTTLAAERIDITTS